MILEFLEFAEMERSLTKFEFCSKNKDGNGCYFEMCVYMCWPGTLGCCRISQKVAQTQLKTGYSKLILLNLCDKNGYSLQYD